MCVASRNLATKLGYVTDITCSKILPVIPQMMELCGNLIHLIQIQSRRNQSDCKRMVSLSFQETSASAADCKLQTANCKLRTADCRLQTANCKTIKQGGRGLTNLRKAYQTILSLKHYNLLPSGVTGPIAAKIRGHHSDILSFTCITSCAAELTCRFYFVETRK